MWRKLSDVDLSHYSHLQSTVQFGPAAHKLRLLYSGNPEGGPIVKVKTYPCAQLIKHYAKKT
jgi:hypothetical protein